MQLVLNRRKPRLSYLQIFVYLLAIFPAVWLIWDGFNGNLTINPIQALTQRTGKYALVFLLLALSCTPINTVFGVRGVLKVRRPLGLTAFVYAFAHFFLFIGVDYAFNPHLLREAILEKPYALVGLSAFLILLVLAITSFRLWMKNLGKLWKKIHRLVYVAGILVVIHYFWVVKGSLLRLSGDILLPLISMGILLCFFVLRLPPVRKWFSNHNLRLTRPKQKSGKKNPKSTSLRQLNEQVPSALRKSGLIDFRPLFVLDTRTNLVCGKIQYCSEWINIVTMCCAIINLQDFDNLHRVNFSNCF